MIIPNYKKDNIVNLMSSILASLGVKSKYNQLKSLSPKTLKKKKNILLIVVDGLGYEWLTNRAPLSFLAQNIKKRLTSVFLPTTAAAIPVFMTGQPVQQHALPGWTVFLKEIGTMTNVLPAMSTMGGDILSNYDVDHNEIYNFESLFDKINRKYFVITEKSLLDSDFNKKVTSTSENISYKGISMNSFFRKIKKVIKKKDKKYVYSYWPFYDKMCHIFGPDSDEALKHFMKFDLKLKKFISSLDLNDTTVILTADHGFVQTPASRDVLVDNHPTLKKCLTMPLCGEGRVRFAYVKPSKAKVFEKYVKTKLSKYCDLIKSENTIKENYFGLFKPNPKLKDRIGDYLLIMKENYCLKDSLINKKSAGFIGHHAGVSSKEMYVPLIVFNKKIS